MWLFYALLAPAFFGLVHVLDAFCVEEIFDKPWLGAITSAVATIAIVFLPLPYLLPFIELEIPSNKVLLLAFVAGALIQVSQVLYFQSLSYSEAGIVAAYWNLIPVFIIVISYLLLDKILAFNHIIGVIILISTSTLMLLLDISYDSKIKTIVLMFAASGMQAITYLIDDWVFEQTTFAIGFFVTCLGIITAGLSPLAIPKVSLNTKHVSSYGKIFILIEALNVIALFFAQLAISLGDPALVAAIETTIPAYAFLISFVFLVSYSKYGDTRVLKKLPLKLTAVGIMSIGVYLISLPSPLN
jgi:drug/metabolite transporter (DMT)-like permease